MEFSFRVERIHYSRKDYFRYLFADQGTLLWGNHSPIISVTGETTLETTHMKHLSLLALLFATSPMAWANGGDENGVAWTASWEEALEEAKIRNAPIHVSYHKDG